MMRFPAAATFKIATAVTTICFMGMPSMGAVGGPTADNAYNTTTDAKKIAWMDRGMEAVKHQLKDPGSAEFRGVYFNRGQDDIPVTCGEVNAKNGFGGYSGFERFISAGKPELTFLESQISDFHNAWARLC